MCLFHDVIIWLIEIKVFIPWCNNFMTGVTVSGRWWQHVVLYTLSPGSPPVYITSSQHLMRSQLHCAVISAPSEITASLSSHLSPHEITASLSTVISAPHKITASQSSQHPWDHCFAEHSHLNTPWDHCFTDHSHLSTLLFCTDLPCGNEYACSASHFHTVLFSCTPFGTKSICNIWITRRLKQWNYTSYRLAEI